MAAEEPFPMFQVTVNYDPALRIDKDRANRSTIATLHPAILKDAGEPFHVVAKAITIRGLGPEAVAKLKECAEINRRLHDHPCIIKVFGVQEINRTFMLFLEKGEGSVRDILSPQTEEMRSLRERLLQAMSLKEIVHQIFIGLAYIHSKTDKRDDKISHRDVKLENILVVALERDGTFAIKFTDFNSAKQLQMDERVSITTGAFTELYISPALSACKTKGLLVVADNYVENDVFACALVAYEVLTEGDCLFQGADKSAKWQMMANMQNNNRENLLKADVDELAKNVLWTMTQPKPEDRISMAEAINAPFFQDDKYQLQMINELNEAIEMDDASSKAIKEELNRSFFMLFQTKWKDLAFVVPEILHYSKYFDDVVAFLRYCRNLLVHAEQHQKALQKHFGVPMSTVDLLRLILLHVCRFLVHFNWFAKRHLPHLEFTKHFPSKCAAAYEDVMQIEREKIGGNSNMQRMYMDVCRKVKLRGADEEGIMLRVYNACKQDVQKSLKRTEADFRALEVNLKEWEEEKNQISQVIAALTRDGGNQADIDAKKREMEALDEKLKTRRFLDWRNRIRKDTNASCMDLEAVAMAVGSDPNLESATTRHPVSGRVVGRHLVDYPEGFPHREYHVVAEINGEIVVWGGGCRRNGKWVDAPPNLIRIYDVESRAWRRIQASGDIPSHSRVGGELRENFFLGWLMGNSDF